MLYVNEIFSSIQGEGVHTGVPSLFVRMQGCMCQCPWCDTKHTWKLGEPNDNKLDFAASKCDAPRYSTCTEDELFDFIQENYRDLRNIIFTGGEPMLFDLRNLSERLEACGHTIAVETSGTEPIQISDAAWVAVSPKLDMPGGRPVLTSALERADEIKMVIGSEADIKSLASRVLPFVSEHVQICLQPLSQDPKATEICTKACMENNWRLSLQTHKFAGIR